MEEHREHLLRSWQFRAGYEVDFSDIKQEEMIRASAEAFNKEYGLMNEIFIRITKSLK